MSGFAGKRVSAEVVQRAQSGDLDAHERIFRTFSAAVYTLAARMTGSRPAAEDILQETFIEVLRGIGRFRGDASLGTWIRRITVSKCLMHMRSAWERRATLFRDLGDGRREFEPSVPCGSARAATGMDIDKALARLSDASRMVVLLHDVEGYTHAEIAALMGRSVSYSKSQLARAHRRLRDWIESADGQTNEQRNVTH